MDRDQDVNRAVDRDIAVAIVAIDVAEEAYRAALARYIATSPAEADHEPARVALCVAYAAGQAAIAYAEYILLATAERDDLN
jgi:hypothetical protein